MPIGYLSDNLMCTNYYSPIMFWHGIIIPLVKVKTRSLNDVIKFRAIALIPVIFQAFQNLQLILCDDYLNTNELQSGFKQGLDCSEAVFALRTNVQHFTSNGSSVIRPMSSLDLRLDFDNVHVHVYCIANCLISCI